LLSAVVFPKVFSMPEPDLLFQSLDQLPEPQMEMVSYPEDFGDGQFHVGSRL